MTDHDDRRRRIATITIDVIAREGLEAATIRRIAAEVGYSTTVVTHYFSDKRELLLWSYRVLAREGVDRYEEVVAADPTDLVGALETMTAIEPSNIRRWTAYLAFWVLAARDPQFAAEHKLSTEEGLASIAGVVRARFGDTIDVDRTSRLLNAAVQGISLQAIVDRETWTADRVRRTLHEAVDMVLRGTTEAG